MDVSSFIFILSGANKILQIETISVQDIASIYVMVALMTETTVNNTEAELKPRKSRQEWNYHPDFPIDNNPLFSWPIRWRDALVYYRDGWLVLSEMTVCIALAVLIYAFATPALSLTKQFEPAWIAMIYARNLAVFVGVTGLLHYYFYTRQNQGTDLKYVPQFLSKGSRFLFNNQLYDNMTWSIGSGVAIWTFYEVIMMWGMANGYVALITFESNPIWTILAMPVISLWISLHFYINHRILHIKPLYDRFHALHHRNVNVGPFSGIAMHPVEHMLYFSSVLIHFVMPTHPMHIILHFYMLALGATFGHTGFDALVVKNKRRLAIGHFHHQLHHRYFECNYGSVDLPWDKFFGTFHDGTAEARAKMNKRIRKDQTA